MEEALDKVKYAEKEIKEAVEAIEEARDAVIDSNNSEDLPAVRDLEKAEDAAIISQEATEEAEFKLKEN